MRIANRKSDPGYHPDWRYARVFLDGVEIKGVCHVADEEQGIVTRYKRDVDGKLVCEAGEGAIETVHGRVRIDLDPARVAEAKALRFHNMERAERGQLLVQHLDAAEKSFSQEAGTDHLFFGVEASAVYCEWLLLYEPDAAAKFLQTMITLHGRFISEAEYRAAETVYRQAKFDLHVALKARPKSSRAT